MIISKLFVAALVVAAVGVHAQAAPTPTPVPAATPAAPVITLSGVTGEVKIVTPGGTMTVKKGEPIPAIPSGSQIVVVSGDASVTAGKVTVNAGAGDSFTINTTGAAVGIAVTGGSVSVVGADGKTQEVPSGTGVTLASTPAPVVVAPAPTAAKAEEPTAPESIPAEDTSANTTTTPPASSPLQETASGNGSTVSPSAP